MTAPSLIVGRGYSRDASGSLVTDDYQTIASTGPYGDCWSTEVGGGLVELYNSGDYVTNAAGAIVARFHLASAGYATLFQVGPGVDGERNVSVDKTDAEKLALYFGSVAGVESTELVTVGQDLCVGIVWAAGRVRVILNGAWTSIDQTGFTGLNTFGYLGLGGITYPFKDYIYQGLAFATAPTDEEMVTLTTMPGEAWVWPSTYVRTNAGGYYSLLDFH